MTILVLGWLAAFFLIGWITYGVITLVATGFLWPLGDGEDDH